MTGTKGEYLALVNGAQGNEELTEGYNGWADSYDEDFEGIGYRLPPLVACLTARYMRVEEGAILDAGAGTGLLGEWLHLAGYRDLFGIDLSARMLAVAERKNVYRDLREMALGERLDFPDNQFRTVASSGAFNTSHAPASSFDELVRITQPGGHLIFSVKQEDIEPAGFRSKFDDLESKGEWQSVEVVGPFLHMHTEPEAAASVFVYQVSQSPN